jgi:hypothetical protein
MPRIECDTSVPHGLVLTRDDHRHVAGLTASTPITFAAEAFVEPAFIAGGSAAERPERQDLSIQLYKDGPDDSSSVALTVSGLHDYPTLTLPDDRGGWAARMHGDQAPVPVKHR